MVPMTSASSSPAAAMMPISTRTDAPMAITLLRSSSTSTTVSADPDELLGGRVPLLVAVGLEEVSAGAAEVVVGGELDRRVDAVVEALGALQRVHERGSAQLLTGGGQHQGDCLVER